MWRIPGGREFSSSVNQSAVATSTAGVSHFFWPNLESDLLIEFISKMENLDNRGKITQASESEPKFVPQSL